LPLSSLLCLSTARRQPARGRRASCGVAPHGASWSVWAGAWGPHDICALVYALGLRAVEPVGAAPWAPSACRYCWFVLAPCCDSPPCCICVCLLPTTLSGTLATPARPTRLECEPIVGLHCKPVKRKLVKRKQGRFTSLGPIAWRCGSRSCGGGGRPLPPCRLVGLLGAVGRASRVVLQCSRGTLLLSRAPAHKQKTQPAAKRGRDKECLGGGVAAAATQAAGSSAASRRGAR
jgi:hypothetical protein